MAPFVGCTNMYNIAPRKNAAFKVWTLSEQKL